MKKEERERGFRRKYSAGKLRWRERVDDGHGVKELRAPDREKKKEKKKG